jgi:hypothetical protein
MNTVRCCFEWEARSLETFLKKLGVKCWSSPDDYESTISTYTVTYDEKFSEFRINVEKKKQ